MSRRMPSFVSICALLTLLLAACGSPAASTSSTTAIPATNASGAATAAGAAAPASGKQVTIRWRTRPSDDAERAVYEKLAASANTALASKNIKVVYEPGVNQGYMEKIKTELAGGSAPDIFWVGGVDLADFVATGQILDLKPFIDKDSSFKLSDFYEQTINELSHDGKVYGLPRDISTMVTYYNADMFKAAGIPNPKELADQGKWNWDAMLASAQKLTDASKQQYGLGFGDWWGPAWGYFVNAGGGNIFNKDRTACGLDSPETAAGAKVARELYDKKYVPAGDADGEALFNAGKVGMYFNGRWFMPGVKTNAKFAYDVAEMPMGKVKSTWLFWGPYLVNAKTADAAAAWEVMKQITSSQSMGEVTAMGANIPARKNQEAVDVFLKSTSTNNQAYIKGAEYAAAEAPVWQGNWADFSDKVQKAWDNMIAGKLTPEEFGKTACDQAKSTFKK